VKITNRFGLPAAIVQAVQNDPYSKGSADFSVTELLKPPQLGHLYRKHENDLSVDVSDEVWRLFGQGVHAVLEKAGEGVKEERLFTQVQAQMKLAEDPFAHTLSGAIDLRSNGDISDYKITAVFTYQRGEFADWIAQMNMYDWLLWKNDIDIKSLKVVVILRDWKKSQTWRKDYPNAPVKMIPVERWTHKYQEEFIRERLELHTAEEPRPCTEEETWGGVRCKDWCPVADFCPQIGGARA